MLESSVSDLVRGLLRTRRTFLADRGDGRGGSERLLVRSDLPGTLQLYEFVFGEQELVQLTSLPTRSRRRST